METNSFHQHQHQLFESQQTSRFGGSVRNRINKKKHFCFLCSNADGPTEPSDFKFSSFLSGQKLANLLRRLKHVGRQETQENLPLQKLTKVVVVVAENCVEYKTTMVRQTGEGGGRWRGGCYGAAIRRCKVKAGRWEACISRSLWQ